MKSRDVHDKRGRRRLARLFAQVLLITLLVGMMQIPASAAGNECRTSSPPSAAYTVTICITVPADGAIVSGVRTVTATVSVTPAGTNPGIARLVFYLGGEYLLTDFQTPFSFSLPTTKWVDGTRLLELEALMKDGFTSQRASISLTFVNGIIQPPVNNNTFTPKPGTTPPSGQSFTLAVSGDGAGGMTTGGQVATLVDSWNPNLFLYLGDVYEDGTYTEFYNWYGTSNTFFGQFNGIANPTVGNHEYRDGGTARGYFNYWDNVPNYYSFDAAGWHIVALNSNCVRIGGCHAASPQYQWLAADLAAHPNVCTAVFYHHPVYFVGPIDDPQNMGAIWSLMAANGVDMVFNGHDHSYQRWKPLDGTGTIASGGVTEFVVGGGGHGLQEAVLTDNRLAKRADTPDSFGALRLQLNQDGAGYQYVNTAGIVMDSGSVVCSGAPADTTPPTRPTNLVASANDSNLVHLTWNASTDNVGVTGYDIYRDGSLLTTVPPVTSYYDGTVSPDTTYSYRIRARDASGRVSSLSTAALVTTPGLLFSDGFESGNFLQWSPVSGLVMQQQDVYAGTRAAQAISNGTPTYAYKTLSQPHDELYYRLWFKILSQGANPVMLQRFRTASNSSAAIMAVSITTTGKLSFRNDVSGLSTTSTTTVTPGVWHQLQTRILINGAAGETEFWLDGVRVDSLSIPQNFGNTLVGVVQLGETTSGRTYNIAIDRVALSTRFIDPAEPPETGTPPTVTPTPTATRTPTATATQPAGPVGVNVWVGTAQPGNHSLGHNQALRVTYPGLNNGPVKLVGSQNIVGSEAVVYRINETNTSFTEMMGLPASQLNTTYWLPWYNNVDLDTQLRFGNVSNAQASVRVFIGGAEMAGGPFVLAPGASLRKSFPGINGGPVKIVSTQNIVAAERVIYKVNGTNTSFSEMMGLPASQLNTTYWLPWYDNVNVDTQLRFANVSNATASVRVFIGGAEMAGSPFSLAVNESTRLSFSGINAGPVKIVSNQNIVVGERVIQKVNNTPTSFSEMLGLPNSQLNTTYWLPWYNNLDLLTELRFGVP
ncbi:MAG TPA: metallophosphoesterase [Anaerolineales bacterium]